MPKRKYEIVSKNYMPVNTIKETIDIIKSPDRFFIATPDITNLGYDVLEWLHTNPKTSGMTNAEWSAILGVALYNLGFDTARRERRVVTPSNINIIKGSDD
ncbi:MAG: hypothetical protein WC516_07940 [Patescibacteria group bacterium]|jgi:hypothetical protein